MSRVNCFLSIEFRAVDVDECSSFPCQNDGSCTDYVDSYTCECQPDFTGEDCETGNDYFLEFSKKFQTFQMCVGPFR